MLPSCGPGQPSALNNARIRRLTVLKLAGDGAVLGMREGVLLVDMTDMPKQGVNSVGVARQ